MSTIQNAVIKSARITTEDHGLLTAWLDLDYGGSGQGFGGYCLYSPKANGTDSSNYCGHFIWRVLQIADVMDWGKLVGKTVRVKGSHRGIQAIGHILKDDWFNPATDRSTT